MDFIQLPPFLLDTFTPPENESASKCRQRHKMELREFEAFASKLRKQFAKGKDKPTVLQRVSDLEAKLHNIHSAQLDKHAGATGPTGAHEAPPEHDVEGPAAEEPQHPREVTMSRTQKKIYGRNMRLREAATADEGRREGGSLMGDVELETVQAELSSRGLRLVGVDPDGSCMFYAVAASLSGAFSREDGLGLRRRVAQYIRSNLGEYADIIAALHAGGAEQYLHDLEHTAMWGDELELSVCARVIGRPIAVVSAGAADRLFEPPGARGAPVYVVYHRCFGLGHDQHYSGVASSRLAQATQAARAAE